MPTKFTRRLRAPERSFFLFGPRGTGKTTWLRSAFRKARWFNLLKQEDMLSLMREPALFGKIIEALPAPHWVVIDEVQKLPSLLDEVHDIISLHGTRYRFAISGSSARKLRRLNVNMLAGRVIRRDFFPLTLAELGSESTLTSILRYGCLPEVCNAEDAAIDILEAYVSTYIKEEIQQEALVENLGSFVRFLEIAATMNGQVVNISGIARDAGIARQTTQRYFDTLVDTLIGVWVRPWSPKIKVREATHPKFYFFDTGVVRTLRNTLRDPIDDTERGALFETWILHELRAFVSLENIGGEIRYWRAPSGLEVDFIWSRGKKTIGIEVKASNRWRPEHGKALKQLLDAKAISAGYGVYLGKEKLKDGDLWILPWKEFCERLAKGEVLG